MAANGGKIDIPYGQGRFTLSPEKNIQVLNIPESKGSATDPLEHALAAPISSPRLKDIVRPGQSVTIITSDITRPCPSHLMLPPLLAELAEGGIPDDQVTIVFAMGIHRPHTQQEQSRLVGEDIWKRIRCIDSDPEQTILVGTTSRGTPIEVFAPVVEADVRIALGNVEPHYYAGYSGGTKALVPGVCSFNTVNHNHARMVEPGAQIAQLEGNPVREDIEEGAALIGLDFILNVILDSQKNIVSAAAGHPVKAHRWAAQTIEDLRGVNVSDLADIVVVSAGGYPKDINLYQAHKALHTAAAIVRPGGIIIWVAECSDGFGQPTFEEWLTGLDPEDILDRIRQQFVMGGHVAASVTRIKARADLFLVSALSPNKVRQCGMVPFSTLDSALQAAEQKQGEAQIITVLPEGSAVVPRVSGVSG
jgi:nickel-dependent lactate racemase